MKMDNCSPLGGTNFTSDSKSVDSLVIMKKERLLLSMSADQYLRFWDIDDL